MRSGEWRVESGEWRVRNREWRVESDESYFKLPAHRRKNHMNPLPPPSTPHSPLPTLHSLLISFVALLITLIFPGPVRSEPSSPPLSTQHSALSTLLSPLSTQHSVLSIDLYGDPLPVGAVAHGNGALFGMTTM